MTVREIPAELRDAAAEQVAAWGYPRPIGLLERRHGYWLTDVPQTGILWLIEGPMQPRHWCVHAVAAPEHRLRAALQPEVFHVIRTVAGLLGAVRVYAPLGAEYPGWARYLRRCGFDQQDEFGPFYELED